MRFLCCLQRLIYNMCLKCPPSAHMHSLQSFKWGRPGAGLSPLLWFRRLLCIELYLINTEPTFQSPPPTSVLPITTLNANALSYALHWSMTSSDLERQDARGQSFLEDLHTYVHVIWPRMTKCGMVTQVGESIFLGVSHAPVRRGWDPRVTQICGTSYMRAHSRRNDKVILHGDQTRCEEIFYRVDNESWRAICLRYSLVYFPFFLCGSVRQNLLVSFLVLISAVKLVVLV